MTPLKRRRLRNKILGSANLSWKTFLVLILAGLLVYFVEGIAKTTLPGLTTGWDFFWAAGIVALLIYLVILWQHDRITRQITATAQTIHATDIKGRPCLICGYSPIKDRGGKPAGPMALDLEKLTNDLEMACDKDRDDGKELGPWQQNLRVLKALNEVRNLYVLLPNVDQFERFVKIVRHYFPEDRLAISLITDHRGSTDLGNDAKVKLTPDYENFRYVTAGIDLALGMIAKDLAMSPEEAEKYSIIDVTAGFKTFSIAAAIASLNRNLLFVYAGTDSNTGQVLAYDASITLTGGGEF